MFPEEKFMQLSFFSLLLWGNFGSALQHDFHTDISLMF